MLRRGANLPTNRKSEGEKRRDGNEVVPPGSEKRTLAGVKAKKRMSQNRSGMEADRQTVGDPPGEVTPTYPPNWKLDAEGLGHHVVDGMAIGGMWGCCCLAPLTEGGGRPVAIPQYSE